MVSPPDARDWLWHALGFAVLGALLRMACAASWPTGYNLKAIAAGAVLGGINELGQIPVPGRSASVSDALADVAGVVAGVMLAGGIVGAAIHSRRRETRR